MKKVFHQSALALIISGAVGASFAANHPASFGVYSTAVQGDRLFIEDGTMLRCDLFFASADGTGHETVVAPKGSRLSQSVPPFVWQYSGLLPVSDYLKTVAIHSVSSMDKERSWQDVQLTFYEGLRAEGARELEAKVAYAGAYAFAPRWPLVDFIDITDPVRDKESRLYRVEYIAASPKGVSIDEYRSLVNDIEANACDISLEDIRGVIDAADAARASSGDDSWLKQIWKNETPSGSKSGAASAAVEAVEPEESNLGMLFASEKKRLAEMAATTEQTQVDSSMPDIVSEENIVELPDVADVSAEVDAVEAVESEQIDSGGNNLGVLFESEKQRLAALQDQGEQQAPEPVADVPVANVNEVTPVSEGGTVVAVPDDVQELSPAAALEEMNRITPVIETDTDVTAESESVADQLAAADREVLVDVEPVPADSESTEVVGEVVDLDLLLLDDAAPDKLFESDSGDQSTEVAQEDWVLMPDGTQSLKF